MNGWMEETVCIDTYVYKNSEETHSRSSSLQNQIHLRGFHQRSVI